MADTPTRSRIQTSTFKPARWLRNRHAQTVFPTLPWIHGPRVKLVRALLELPDGDITTVEWMAGYDEPGMEQRPMLVILHGLEGSARSPYCQQLMWAAAARGWRTAVLHFRDCGDYRNRLPRRYHAGETDDLRYFLDELQRAGQQGPVFAAGYSLGGNVLLKYLGESGVNTVLSAAVAVSVPLNLHVSAKALNQGFSKLYQKHLLRRMKSAVKRKFNPDTAAFDWQRAMAAHNFAEFDDAVTAPLHGFNGRDDYYDRCSAGIFLDRVEKPTLIINALDDPFMTPEVIPPDDRIASCVTIEVSDHGGHVGFIDGGKPWQPRYFLPQRIAKYLDSFISADTTLS